MSKKNSFNQMLSVQQMISNKIMMVDAKNYHVAMLEELWNMYYDDARKNLCQNIMNYCKVENSFNQITFDKDVLLISIKESNDETTPFAYYKNGEIELIKESGIIRNTNKKLAQASVILLKRILLTGAFIVAIIGIILYFIFK